MILKLIIICIILLALVFILMGIGIILKKGGKFPNIHIGSNPEMKKRGISCATTQDKESRESTIKITPEHLKRKY